MTTTFAFPPVLCRKGIQKKWREHFGAPIDEDDILYMKFLLQERRYRSFINTYASRSFTVVDGKMDPEILKLAYEGDEEIYCFVYHRLTPDERAEGVLYIMNAELPATPRLKRHMEELLEYCRLMGYTITP